MQINSNPAFIITSLKPSNTASFFALPTERCAVTIHFQRFPTLRPTALRTYICSTNRALKVSRLMIKFLTTQANHISEIFLKFLTKYPANNHRSGSAGQCNDREDGIDLHCAVPPSAGSCNRSVPAEIYLLAY